MSALIHDRTLTGPEDVFELNFRDGRQLYVEGGRVKPRNSNIHYPQATIDSLVTKWTGVYQTLAGPN